MHSFRDLHALRAVQRGHLNLTAQRNGREVHGDFAEQVVAVAPEELVLLHMYDDEEVSRRTAGRPGFAFMLKAELLAGGNAGRNFDGELPFARNPSRATASE